MRINSTQCCAIVALWLTLAMSLSAQEQPASLSDLAFNQSSVAPGQIELGNAFCPVMPEEEVDPSFFSVYEGRTVFLCCKRCRTKFQSDPESYAANLPPLAVAASALSGSFASPQDHDEAHEHPEQSRPTQSAHELHQGEVGAHEEPHGGTQSVTANEEHDHAAHAQETTGLTPVFSYLGRFHVLVTHFPIGLLTFGALFEIVFMLGIGGSKSSGALGVVRASVGVGALASVAAVVLGLMNAIGTSYSGVLADAFWWHRLLGLITTGMAIVAWVAVERRARKSTPNTMAFARAAVLLTAAFVGITGHLGGSLVFGWEYLIP